MTPRPPPSIGLMPSAGRPAAWPRQAEGRTIEVESSSLAPRASPHDRVTTPAGREEPGTSLYPSYNDPPDAPRPRQCQGGDFRRLCRAGMAGFRVPGGSQLEGHPSYAACGGQGRGGGRGARREREQYGFKRSRPRLGCNKPASRTHWSRRCSGVMSESRKSGSLLLL